MIKLFENFNTYTQNKPGIKKKDVKKRQFAQKCETVYFCSWSKNLGVAHGPSILLNPKHITVNFLAFWWQNSDMANRYHRSNDFKGDRGKTIMHQTKKVSPHRIDTGLIWCRLLNWLAILFFGEFLYCVIHKDIELEHLVDFRICWIPFDFFFTSFLGDSNISYSVNC